MDVKVRSMSFGEYIEGHGHAVEVRRGEVMDHIDGRYQYSIFNLNPRVTVERVGGAGQFAQLECRISIPAYGFIAQQAFPVTILAPQTTSDILLPFNGIHTIGKIEPKPADLELEILDKGQVVFGAKLPIAFVVPATVF